VAAVADEFRAAWGRWGRPRLIQVDNGSPWGSWSDLPPPLALWLVGLGLQLRWIPPRRPQHNGVAERTHGVTQAWAEAGQCPSALELQQRIDREDVVQREKYPHRGGLPRAQVYAGLRHSGRDYDAAWERANWSWPRVCAHLGEYAVDRRVDRSGKIGLYHDKVYVGIVLRGQGVIVQFDPRAVEWVVGDRHGRELTRRPLTQFDSDSLRAVCGGGH